MKRRLAVVTGKPRPEATKLDWCLLHDLVRDVEGSQALSTKFSLYSLRCILQVTADEAREAITDASQDRGVDAVHIDDETQSVHLFQFKYHETGEHVRKQFPSRSVDFLISFVTDLLDRNETLLETTNSLLKNKVLAIWEAIQKKPARIHIHFVSNGRALEPIHRRRLTEALARYGVVLHEYGSADLLRKTHGRSSEKVRKRLVFVSPRQEFTVNGKRMIVGLVRLLDIAEMVSQEERPSEIDSELFADNVRGVLGLSNDVNKAMLRTMVAPSGAEFVFRNNGVTIVAEQILCQMNGNFPVEMVAPQIVNGCQTVSTAFAAFSKNKAMLDRGAGQAVLVKIIESRDAKITEDIALSTNSQTRIFGRDLRAIDETQIKIERLLRKHGFAYLRKRSDTSDLPRCQTIDMARIGQLILAYYRHLPEQAKTRTNEIFGDMYDDIFDVQFLDSPKLIAVHTLNYMLEERRQSAKQRLRSPDTAVYDEEWILEGSYHVLFVVNLLCQRDGVDSANLNQAVSRLNEAVVIVGDFVKSHPTVAAYRLFRTVGTADALSKIVSGTVRRRGGIREQLELF